MSSNSKKIGVMIPTYNEVGNIERLIRTIFSLDLSTSIVVVDDNSQDGTAKILDNLSKEFPQLHVIHRFNEKGRASAGIRGFLELIKLNVDYIIEMDADFSHDPAIIPSMVKEARDTDIIIGSRYVPGGKSVNCTKWGHFRSIAINFCNSILFGVYGIKDLSGGFKCYHLKVIEAINWNEFISKAYSVGIEILLRAKNHGFTMKEIPITFKNREQGSSKADWKVTIDYPLTLLSLKFHSLKKKLL